MPTHTHKPDKHTCPESKATALQPQCATENSSAQQASDRRSPQIVLMAPSNRQTVWWVMTVVLAVMATALIMRLDDKAFLRSALAQSVDRGVLPIAGARGIHAFTGQLSSKTHGLFMLDVDAGTIWCYGLEKGRDGETRLRLVAARSWIFDRHLEEFNVAAPTPNEVRMMVQQQTSHASNVVGTHGNTVSQERTSELKPPSDVSKVALPKSKSGE